MHSTIDIRTSDGNSVKASLFTPPAENGKVVIVGSSAGFSKEYYQAFSAYLQQSGYTVISFDYRGNGRLAPEERKKVKTGMHQWAVKDLDAVLLFTVNRFPMKELIYVGHCVAGEMIGLARASEYLDRIVLVSSALSCRRYWPLKDKIRTRINKWVARFSEAWYGFFPGRKMGYMHDIPSGVILEWSSWCQHPNGLFGYYPDNNYRKLRVPLLSFSFSDDWHGPPGAVKELLSRFSDADITWHHIRPAQLGVKQIGNHGYFLPEHEKTLWDYTLKWMNREQQTRDIRPEWLQEGNQ